MWPGLVPSTTGVYLISLSFAIVAVSFALEGVKARAKERGRLEDDEQEPGILRRPRDAYDVAYQTLYIMAILFIITFIVLILVDPGGPVG